MRRWVLTIKWSDGHLSKYAGEQDIIFTIAHVLASNANVKMKLRTEVKE